MDAMAEILDLVKSIQTERKSGVVMVTGVGDRAMAPSITYSMRFESGQLSRASGGGQYKGIEAVRQLCRSEQVSQLRWMALGSQANWAGEPDVPARDLVQLLSQAVSAREHVRAEQSAKADTDALLARVEDVFVHFYVGDAKADLAVLQERYPPDVKRTAFLDACVKLLRPWIGEKEARRLLKD